MEEGGSGARPQSQCLGSTDTRIGHEFYFSVDHASYCLKFNKTSGLNSQKNSSIKIKYNDSQNVQNSSSLTILKEHRQQHKTICTAIVLDLGEKNNSLSCLADRHKNGDKKTGPKKNRNNYSFH